MLLEESRAFQAGSGKELLHGRGYCDALYGVDTQFGQPVLCDWLFAVSACAQARAACLVCVMAVVSVTDRLYAHGKTGVVSQDLGQSGVIDRLALAGIQ